MKVKDGDFVMPGDVLGIIEQFLPGEGTYDNEGYIKSSILGNVQINSKMKTISVMPKSGKPALLEVGDTVYGQITDVKAQRVNVNIDRLKNTTRPLALPYIGAIHISQVKEGYLDKLTDAFKLGFKHENIFNVKPDYKFNIRGLEFITTPAYNIDKPFHPKVNEWVGYIIDIKGVKYYFAGDTDFVDEA